MTIMTTALDKNMIPDFKIQEHFFCNQIIEIDNKFLQNLVDVKAVIYCERDYFIMLAYESLAMFFVRQDSVHLECISTPHDLRGKGSATKTLTAIIHCARKAKQKITLTTANVKRVPGWCGPMPPLPISIGQKTENRIPPKLLYKFYEKFGFRRTKKLERGYWAMEFQP